MYSIKMVQVKDGKITASYDIGDQFFSQFDALVTAQNICRDVKRETHEHAYFQIIRVNK